MPSGGGQNARSRATANIRRRDYTQNTKKGQCIGNALTASPSFPKLHYFVLGGGSGRARSGGCFFLIYSMLQGRSFPIQQLCIAS
jgi:hypothetical protein